MNLTPLAPRARWLFHLQALVRLATIGPVVAIGSAVGLWLWVGPVVGVGVGASLGLLMTLWALWMPSLAFDRWGYGLDDRELLIQRGILVRRLTAIPVGRIQHVDTYQGPMDQLLGLARLHVYTASGMGADGVIPGLDAAEATRLRDALVDTEGDDGV